MSNKADQIIQFRLLLFLDTLWVLMFAHIYVQKSILRGQKIYDKMRIYLFATIKLPRAIGSHTLARWITIFLECVGIDITLFKSHSTRHAAATAVHGILKRAGWSNATIFRQFYYKGVIE